MVSFLITEREQAGWRFLLLWIIATNLGFLVGIGIEVVIIGRPTLYLAVPLASLGQAYVLNRHISIYLPWAVGSTIFWLIGIAVSGRIIDMMMPPQTTVEQIAVLVLVAFIGGLLAAIPQWLFMRDWLPVGLWWLIVNAISSALIILPGVIVGIIIMRLVTADKIAMDERHYELSGDL